MLDYNQINYIINKKNYSLWRISDTKYDITKNEYGTYDEYYDLKIFIEIDELTSIVKYWSIYSGGDIPSEQFEHKLRNMYNSNILFENFCFAIANEI